MFQVNEGQVYNDEELLNCRDKGGRNHIIEEDTQIQITNWN